ncbi:ATP-dependent zinc metalloprotease FtsH [Geoalkalibacter subterraneus]|jgi:cell division protease FtsH|uniref:ATP-dependent zinc metalloprotease FtsH n=1 Tax=Geoalkalibacter subterraneus TaxID=483547 RepID=A0A0B5FBB4_9BACT|nr:ATP-dependent zinc metalloprotease FtsH [Geoalkalibacter subterraneus]AJF05457.1 cell division protein FtsH [Geoalkalibacter subterraneus]
MEKKTRFSIWYVLIAFWLVLLIQNLIVTQYGPRRIAYSEFLDALEEGRIIEVAVSGDVVSGQMRAAGDNQQSPLAFVTHRVEPELAQKLAQQNVKFRGEPKSTILRDLLSWIIPVFLFFGLWLLLMRRFSPGSPMLEFGKSKARVYAEQDIDTRFEDVAGAEEAKEELAEIVEFLKSPERFESLGGRMPKGVLLVGPPGTGKTLLARAVAGEAGIPFFSISGSDFVEMFVGVGAARVRELFRQSREKAPCIIFIDELDAIGKARGAVTVGGHDERENTLNQLLVEMDGFDPRSGVVILAATNRPEILDLALLRAGRFDRQILVDRPDLRGREAILRVHTRKIALGEDVDLNVIARKTPGFSGADLANIVNEAALLAARKNKRQVEMSDFDEAIDRVTAGLEKKNRLINAKEREIVAYHETGHALVAAFTPGAEPVHKISIVPRGLAALGYTQQLPTEERYLMTRGELLGKIDVLLGGRVAEMLVFCDVSTGAHNDLQRATDIAQAMLEEYGMGNTLGLATYPRRRGNVLLGEQIPSPGGKPYSEATAARLDEEVRALLAEREQSVRALLESWRELLEKIARRVLEVEVIDEKTFNDLIGRKEEG